MKPRALTLATLKRKGACDGQCALFAEKFGKSVLVTEELCVSVAPLFDWSWAAQNLLSAPALDEYWRVKASASAGYERVTASAQDEYKRVKASTFARLYCGLACGEIANRRFDE